MGMMNPPRAVEIRHAIPELIGGGGAPRQRRSRLALGLIASAALFLVALIAMVAFVIAAAPPDRLEAVFTADPRGFLFYRLGFVSASLLAPALVTMLVLLLVARGAPAPAVRDGLGVLFLAMYPPLSSIAYSSQYALLPRLLEGHPAAAASWYFHDSRSIPYVLDLLGYTLFGFAAMLLAWGFLARAGLWRGLGAALLASGVTSILAFIAIGAQLETAHSVLSISSAALTIPVAGMALIVGLRLRQGKEG